MTFEKRCLHHMTEMRVCYCQAPMHTLFLLAIDVAEKMLKKLISCNCSIKCFWRTETSKIFSVQKIHFLHTLILLISNVVHFPTDLCINCFSFFLKFIIVALFLLSFLTLFGFNCSMALLNKDFFSCIFLVAFSFFFLSLAACTPFWMVVCSIHGLVLLHGTSFHHHCYLYIWIIFFMFICAVLSIVFVVCSNLNHKSVVLFQILTLCWWLFCFVSNDSNLFWWLHKNTCMFSFFLLIFKLKQGC